jgi:DNA-binding IclR family transcriptional regulator
MTTTELRSLSHATTRPAEPADCDKARSVAGAVGKAVLILRIIAGSMRPVTLSMVSREAMLPKSTVHRLLRILEFEGVIFRVGSHYKLRQDVLGMRQEVQARERAMPAMLRIYEATHLLVQLMILDNDAVRCVEQFDSGLVQVEAGAARGAMWPAASTAAGQALLACRQERAIVRSACGGKAKVFFDRGATHQGWATAAVPVVSEDHVWAAVSVTGPFRVLAMPDVVAAMAHLGRVGGPQVVERGA